MKTAMYALLFVLGCAGSAFATFRFLEAQEPTTREECYIKISKQAQSEAAVVTARVACDRQFPESRNRFQQFR